MPRGNKLKILTNHMRKFDRHFVFRHYWWIAICAAAIAGCLLVRFGGNAWVGLWGSVVAGVLGFCYFTQQQKLAETTLFHKIFTDFNARYDKLNGDLVALLSAGEISSEQRNLIVDYFNLCAEEYLFFRQGYIPRDVWRSWCRGMAWYLKRHPFKDVWNEEIQTESFYGLSLTAISDGAL
jgi:hypothetical protein